MKTIVLVPTYNEAKIIETTLSRVLDDHSKLDVLVIDDGSPDGTAAIVKSMMVHEPRLQLLERTQKLGLGEAYKAGFQWSLDRGYELIIEMDSDGSHRSQDLERLIEAAQASDLVIGSRWIPGGEVENWPLLRRLISRVGNWFASKMLGSTIADLTSGYRIFRASLLRELPLHRVQAHGYGFQVEMAWRAELQGSKIAEVPILFVERETGESKMTFGIVLEAFRLICKWALQKRFGKNFLKRF